MNNVDGLIYLASPYSHPDPAVRQQRFETVCHTAAYLMQAGHFIFSPIAHTHPICLAGELPPGFEYWQALDKLMLGLCSEMWVVRMDGWEQSVGVKAEMEYMNRLGKPVRFV